MKSLLPLFISLIGLLVLILIYYVFIYQKPETPFDVFLKLVRNNQQTVFAFTYKKTGPNEYLNYYVNENLDLEPRTENHPVTFDSLPVSETPLHGTIFDIDNGFGVTGIEFPFRCPNGWTYNNGKCIINEICNPEDIDVFKGINYYQFSESFVVKASENTLFHPRLYVDCNTGQRKNCGVNELYIGGESMPNHLQPCEPYDICQDRLTLTTHNFPIFKGDKLGPNEFYICQNGKSVRRSCPANTLFSRTQNGCLPVSRCFDQPDNTTLMSEEPNEFILCLGGQENIVRCGNGIFVGAERIECRNRICVNPQIIYERFNNLIQIPIGRTFCLPNSNTPTEFRCPITVNQSIDDVSNLVNINFPTVLPPQPRFEPFNYPDIQYDTENDNCIPYVLDTDFIVQGTHNIILPDVPINVITKQIQYSARDEEDEFYFKNYNTIKNFPQNQIVVTGDAKYANFTTFPNLEPLEYVDSVRLVTGDSDGVNYLISGPIDNPLLSTISIFLSPDGRSQSGLVWNAYRGEFSGIDEAHSLRALSRLSGWDFNQQSFVFRYSIIENEIDVITPYGYVTFSIKLHDNVSVDTQGHVIAENLPYELLWVDANLAGPITTMVVTDIYDNAYNPTRHRPYFLSYLDIEAVLEPQNTGIEINKFFEVDSRSLFKNRTLFED